MMSISWRRTRLICVLIVGGALVACFAWMRRPGDCVDELATVRALEAGRCGEAEEHLKKWLAKRPDSPLAHYHGGRVALARDDVAAAVEHLESASRLGCPRGELKLLTALIQSKVGRHKEALPVLWGAFNAASRPDPRLDEALAKSCLETYDLVGAGRAIDRWIRDAPNDPKPYLWRAEIHGRSDESDLNELANDYREAIARDPLSAKARLGLAETLLKAHRNEDAADAYDAYLKLRPEDALGHLGAGRNLIESGLDDLANNHLQRALAIDPNNAPVLGDLAELAARRGDLETALDFLDRAIQLDPYETTLRSRRRLTLMRLGRVDEAKKEQAVLKRLRDELHFQ